MRCLSGVCRGVCARESVFCVSAECGVAYCVTLISGIQTLGECFQSVLYVCVKCVESKVITRVAALQIQECLMALWRLCALRWGFEVSVGCLRV